MQHTQNTSAQGPTAQMAAPRAGAHAPARRSGARPRTRDGLARPKMGEVRVRVGALGLSSLGIEGAPGIQATGLISAVGPEAGGFAPGDRVAYIAPHSDVESIGLSSVVSERELIGFPKDVSVEAAAAYLPLGLVARTVVKQLHSVGRGNRVAVADDAGGADAFVRAWVRDLGADVVAPGAATADVVVTANDYLAARRWRYANGLAQIAAADVFQEVRRGIFDEITVTNYPISEARRARVDLENRVASNPVVLLPTAA